MALPVPHRWSQIFLYCMIKYIRKIKIKFENILSRLFGSKVGFNHEKIELKILWRTPLNAKKGYYVLGWIKFFD